MPDTIIRIALPFYLAAASRLHGGGIVQHVPRHLRNLVYAAPYALLYPDWHGALAFAFAFVGINLGHEDFWYMATAPSDEIRNGPVNAVASLFFKPDTLPYCILGLALIGAFMAAGTLNPLIMACHAVTLPSCYYISFRFFKTNVVAEWANGFFCGLSLLLKGIVL